MRGKAIKEICVSYEYGDHPRLCGDKLNSQNWLFMSQGSPPPMRGKAIIDYATSVIWGITPAYAGKRNEVVTMGLFD